MKSLRILIYDTNYMKGASRMIGLFKIKYWQKHGCAITILCSKDAEEFYKTKLNNITYIPIDYTYNITGPLSVPREYTKINFIVLRNLKKLIGKFDVVYSQCAVIDFLFVPWVLKFFDKHIKWFVMVDNLVPPPHQRPGDFLQKLIPYLSFLVGNQLLKKTDGIFVVTDFLKNYYKKKGIRVTKTNDGYGIEVEIFKGGIQSHTPKFDAIYCGRIHIAKGIFDLIEVVKRVVSVNKQFTLGILGTGDSILIHDLENKIKENKLEKNISLLGYKAGKEKADIIRNSGFFLFLSYDEGCPHAVIEAFAVNKLVVAYDLPIYHGVFAKYIKKGQMVLFREKDFEAIADYIAKKPYKNVKFSNKLEDYTWDDIVKNELKAITASKDYYVR